MRRVLFPPSVYNLISLLGVGLALFGLAAILILYFMDVLTKGTNPYLGIFIFLLFPGVLVLGLLLIPLGAWRERRRRERGASEPLVIDLGEPRHRNALVTFVAGTSVFLLLTTIGLYKGYQYTESVEFCGKVCHAVMEPEHTLYFRSAHAKVDCVACHIGPGADWYVKSKFSGARQVFKVALGTYPRPIPTPVKNLRPAQDVCEECHWPEKFFPATVKVFDYFLSDRENTRWRLDMLIKVGGSSASPQGHASGIHWHVDAANQMTYVATDSSRQAFDQVTWRKDGRSVVYSRTGEPLPDSLQATKGAKGLVRDMDCMDCHNRPSHRYQSPLESIDEALATGVLDASLPWIKREAARAVSAEYASVSEAREAIASSLDAFYARQGIALPREAVDAVQSAYERNHFPRMRASWLDYPENMSHLNFPGCFRCHGSSLRTASGDSISADCTLCHSIVRQGPASGEGAQADYRGLVFRHPIDVGRGETELPCTDCHIGDASLYDAPRRDLGSLH